MVCHPFLYTLGYAIIQLPEMIISFLGFIKKCRFYMGEKFGRVQPMQCSTNKLKNSEDDGGLLQIKSREYDKIEKEIEKENYEYTTEKLENMESRLKFLERGKEFSTQTENHGGHAQRFEKLETKLEYLLKKINQLETKF